MNWAEFAGIAPDLARLGDDRFGRSGLALVGTIRRDGSPRISPVEPYIVNGELLLGMMWQSWKALDLLRDPRLVVHSSTADRSGGEGDFKLYGRAIEEPRDDWRVHYGDATKARINWRPSGPFHLFRIDIESAAYVVFTPDAYGLRWSAGGAVERFEVPNE
jgi:hypothetical protein